jgi:hypothetical protein
MRGARSFVAVLAVLAAACTADEPRGWTRVVELGEEGQYYSLVHADREADVCVMLELGEPFESEIDNVLVRGGNYVEKSTSAGPWRADCTNGRDGYSSGDRRVTGKVTFHDFSNTVEPNIPCTVSFELEIEGFEGEMYEMSAKKFPILDVGCPRPGVYAAEYTQLDAAVGVYEGHETVVISAWDPTREVCVWARLSTDPELPDSDVEVPDAWVYSGLRFGLTEEADCSAAQFVRPPINPTYMSTSVDALHATGAVRFLATDDSGWPCALDVDLDLRTLGQYDWTADDVHMRGVDVKVVGACD